jgi:hypothetical protein
MSMSGSPANLDYTVAYASRRVLPAPRHLAHGQMVPDMQGALLAHVDVASRIVVRGYERLPTHHAE